MMLLKQLTCPERNASPLKMPDLTQIKILPYRIAADRHQRTQLAFAVRHYSTRF
jgi:hypothetical protein